MMVKYKGRDKVVRSMTKAEKEKQKLQDAEEENQAKGHEIATEQLRNTENERDTLKNENDQERIAYQKLLKAYNKLEAQYENSQDELNALKNPDGNPKANLINSLRIA